MTFPCVSWFMAGCAACNESDRASRMQQQCVDCLVAVFLRNFEGCSFFYRRSDYRKEGNDGKLRPFRVLSYSSSSIALVSCWFPERRASALRISVIK